MSEVRISPLFGRDVRRVHCLGVGGMGVGPLAIYLAGLGFAVSGEDDGLGLEMGEQLARAGVELGALPVDCDLVVRTSAIGAKHAGFAAAVSRGLPVVRRGELLAELVRDKKLVAVCGSHGKTTTTAMLITALRAANFPAAYVLGGLFADGSAPAAAVGRAGCDWVVAEVDESDGTIDRFSPEITVAVNLDWDHPDHYKTPIELNEAFLGLFARTKTHVLVEESNGRAGQFTFGPTGSFGFTVTQEDSAGLRLALTGKFGIASAVVKARGAFNAANAAAALAAAQLMGVELKPSLLSEFPGVRRRQSVLSTASGITVIEDYAHHPAEIRVLLASLRQRLSASGRLWVVFQPHRYSRTAQFAPDFAQALQLADFVHLLDVYSAGESPIPGGDSTAIQALLSRWSATSGRAGHSPSSGPKRGQAQRARRSRSTYSADINGFDGDELRAGDILAFVGAGDIERQARSWLASRTTDWDDWARQLAALVSPATKVRREEPLARKTTLRVGGAARVYVEPADEADLRTTLISAAAAHLRVFGLGRGSNLIVPDAGVDGVVIALAHPHWSRFEPSPDGSIWVGAGLRLKNLCGLAAAAGRPGFEFLEGIPGSVGGALRMNAGAMGGWMFDVVEEVELMTWDGILSRRPKSAMHIAYRHCAELHEALALGARLRAASPADIAAETNGSSISRQIDAYRQKRHESQPREPSAGCIFKNPPGNSAGKLIDQSGLKGERVGDAEVSPVHANFIVNRGDATSSEVLELIRRVRARVRETQGVELEPEVLLYGQEWKDVL